MVTYVGEQPRIVPPRCVIVLAKDYFERSVMVRDCTTGIVERVEICYVWPRRKSWRWSGKHWRKGLKWNLSKFPLLLSDWCVIHQHTPVPRLAIQQGLVSFWGDVYDVMVEGRLKVGERMLRSSTEYLPDGTILTLNS